MPERICVQISLSDWLVIVCFDCGRVCSILSSQSRIELLGCLARIYTYHVHLILCLIPWICVCLWSWITLAGSFVIHRYIWTRITRLEQNWIWCVFAQFKPNKLIPMVKIFWIRDNLNMRKWDIFHYDLYTHTDCHYRVDAFHGEQVWVCLLDETILLAGNPMCTLLKVNKLGIVYVK